MKFMNISLLLLGMSSIVSAQTPELKQTLQANYMVNYEILPQPAQSLSEIFSEGMVYGRLRANWFFYEWEHDTAVQESHNILGIGGALVYKTAPYEGLSATVGFNYTSAGTKLDDQPSNVALLRAGKDTISRFNAVNGKGKSFGVLSQSYLQYEQGRSKARIGREIFNSFFTKSNDSKMIPNTFEGITFETKEIPKTRLRAAYLTRQKLRDHDNFHSVIMYDDRSDIQSGVINANWDENDDSAIHRGLNYTNFQKIGQDENPGLVVIDGYTRGVISKDLKVSASVLYLKDLFYTGMVEMNYGFDIGGGFRLSPGVRYVQQFDDGAGKIGGASLSGLAASDANGGTAVIRAAYSDPESVDASMFGGRLVLDKGQGSLSLGYTDIADKADFITPWRGFVTSGYTRAMARYNWIANTKTYRVRGSYDFREGDVVSGLQTFLSFTHESYDEDKTSIQDANVYYLGVIKTLENIPAMSARFRAEYVEKTAPSSNDHTEVRMELNYLF